MLLRCLIWVLVGLFPCLPVMAAGEDVARVVEGFRRLNERYYSPVLKIWLGLPGDDLRGHFEGRVNPPWWSGANVVEGMIDFMNATGRMDYDVLLAELYELHREPMKRWPLVAAELQKRGQWPPGSDEILKQKQPKGAYESSFRNEYLDDSGWWGLAWLKMAARTGDEKYLTTAKAIHAHMAGTWQPEPGGGVLWCLDPEKRHANTITNNLFLILSARLAVVTGDQAYAGWAEKTYAWFQRYRLYDGTGVVDGPRNKKDYWSYNQGTWLMAMVAYGEMKKDPQFLEQAADAALRMMDRGEFLTGHGVIREKLGTRGWDGCLFKGVLARGVAVLRDALREAGRRPEVSARMEKALTTTAAALHSCQPDKDGQFPASWHAEGKNQKRNFNTDVSGLLALVAVLPAPPSAVKVKASAPAREAGEGTGK